MPKKIIDIFPPKSVSQPSEPTKPKEQETTRSVWKKALPAFFLILILTFFALHFFFAGADIEIWPEVEPFSLSERVVIDTKAGRPDLASKVVPGKIFDTEKTVSEEFSSTGSAFKKAEGTIRLFNSYTAQPETWLQGTRFVSSEGKLFFSKDRIAVPGAMLKNGKITPSFVDVQVVAAKAGEEYNIGPSNFSISAFLGTARYTKYYGESSQAMAGGGRVDVVTKEDLERAENILIEKAKTEAESEIKRKTPEGFVILAQTRKENILEKSSSVEEGDEAEKFEFRVKIRLTVVSFELKDIEEFAVSSIISRIPEGKNFHRESLKTEYQTETIREESGQFVISLSISTKIYPALDLNSLKKGLLGKPLLEAKILLANQQDIMRAEIRVFPFWLNSVPDKLEKININLKVE